MKVTLLIFISIICIQANALAKYDEAVPGEFVVRLKDEYLVADKANAWGSALGGYVKKTIPGQNIVVLVRPMFEIADSAMQILQQNPFVQIVEPNYIYHANKIPNDPMFDELWGLKNTGQRDSDSQAGVKSVDISAEKAWDIETGSKKVIVAVIDSGIDFASADLKENIWTNEVEAAGVIGVDDDANGYVDDIHGYDFVNTDNDPSDDFGHGTHCAGIIGARGDDGVGVAGVVWNTNIMVLKILDSNGKGSLDNAIAAVDYATKMGARIMSNSWGGSAISENLRLAIQKTSDFGALFVVAAGNESQNIDKTASYPSSYPIANIIAVAAVDNKGKLASFSNYGKNSVHVAAPGVNILSTVPGGYSSWSGTSMATPYVTGVAALLAAHEPQLTNVEIKNRIMNTATPLKSLTGKILGHGMVNAYGALANKAFVPENHLNK